MTRWLVWLFRLALAAIFIVAAVPKILQPHEFALAVFRYQILPYGLINLMAICLPWIELFSGLALIFVPRLRDAALLVITGLLVIFTAAIGLNLYRGISIACGCFTVSAEAEHAGWTNLARNTAFILMALYVFLKEKRNHLRPV